MRVAITGGSGFIGTNLVELYLSRDVPVLSLDPAVPRKPEHRQHWQQVDPLSAPDFRRRLGDFQPTHLFHLGARTDLRGDSLEDYAYNTDGVALVIDALTDLSAMESVVFASSRLVCRTGYRPQSETDYSPPNPYGESKVVGEEMVRQAKLGIPWAIIRPTSIWGPWFDIPYRTFFMTIAANRYVHVGRSPVHKSFGYVGNTVEQLHALIGSLDETVRGKTIYVADHPPIEVREMATTIQKEIGSRPIRTVPRAAIRPVAAVGDVLQRLGWSEPPITSFRLSNILTEMVLDTEPIRRVLHELPHSQEDGIRRTVAWLRTQGLIASNRSRGAV